MEKTYKRVEGTRLRSGRIALGEITNVATKDRRKPGLVRRVTASQVKGNKRVAVPSGANVKRCKESTVKCEQVKTKTVEDIENVPPIEETQLSNGNSEEFEAKCRVEDFDKDQDKTLSCDITTSLRTTNEISEVLTQYDRDIYDYLLQMERQRLLKQDHLKDKTITSKIRQTVVDWLFEVQCHFRLCQESVEQTVAIMDHCLARDPTIDQATVQLVCIASMFIAIKYQETFLLELSDLRHICDYCYQEKEILQMEKTVLTTLDFKLGYPLKSDFCGIYMKTLQKNRTVEKFVRYYIDLSLLEYKLASVEPSRTAAACLYLALCVCNGTLSDSWLCTKSTTNYTIQDLKQAIALLATKALAYVETGKGGLYNKYMRDTRQGSLSHILKSQIYSHTLKHICTVLP